MSLALASLLVTLAGAASAAPAGAELPQGLPEGWYAIVETDAGTIVARMLVRQAPQSVAHVAALAQGRLSFTDAMTGETVRRPFYDGLVIHRIVTGDRFEVGDPTGTGRGAPPIWVPSEEGSVTFDAAYRMGLTRTGQGKVNGAMFFVTAIPEPWLNRRHPCFGEVVAGREVVDRIVATKANEEGKPAAEIAIRKFTLRSVGSPPPIPEPIPYVPQIPRLQPKLP